MAQSIYDFAVTRIDGKKTTLKAYEGKVLLVVNVASKCGLTPQYDALEGLHEKYSGQGLAVLGFPANEFGAQEPGTNEEIHAFCQSTFDVKFDMFQKLVVKGPSIHPLYAFLTQAQPDAYDDTHGEFQKKLSSHGLKREDPSEITWNFEKFLVDRHGTIIARFAPNVVPDNPHITGAVETALAQR